MRLFLSLALGAFALSGCMTAPETRTAERSPATAKEEFALVSDQAREANRSDLASAAYALAASDPSDGPQPAGFLCNCRVLTKENEKLQKRVEELELQLATKAAGFEHVTLEWVKAALYYRGFYEVAPGPRLRSLLFSAPGVETVKASQRFQCAFKRPLNTGGCGPAPQTGWLTFIEARDAVCRGAYAFIDPGSVQKGPYIPLVGYDDADPDLTIEVARWYEEGLVYKKDPRIAYFLLNRLIANITDRFERENDPDERKRLSDFQQDAINGMNRIARQEGIRITDIRQPPDELRFNVEQVCPTAL